MSEQQGAKKLQDTYPFTVSFALLEQQKTCESPVKLIQPDVSDVDKTYVRHSLSSLGFATATFSNLVHSSCFVYQERFSRYFKVIFMFRFDICFLLACHLVASFKRYLLLGSPNHTIFRLVEAQHIQKQSEEVSMPLSEFEQVGASRVAMVGLAIQLSQNPA